MKSTNENEKNMELCLMHDEKRNSKIFLLLISAYYIHHIILEFVTMSMGQ